MPPDLGERGPGLVAHHRGASCRGRDGTGRSGRGTEVRNVVAFGTSGVMEMVARWVGARARGGPADDGGGVARGRGAGGGRGRGRIRGTRSAGKGREAAHRQVALRAPMRVPKQNPDADEVASLDTQPSDMGTTARKRCHRSGRVSSRGGTRARVDARTRRTRDRRCSVRQHSRRCRRSVFATPLEVRARGSVCEAATPAVPHRIQTGAPCDPLARQKSPPVPVRSKPHVDQQHRVKSCAPVSNSTPMFASGPL